jgi:hypothetical protein
VAGGADERDQDRERRRRAIVRTGIVLASIAAAFFVGIVIRYKFFG